MRVTSNTKVFARKVLKYIKAHPEKHNQQYFFNGVPGGCGTSMCVAGTVSFLKYGKDAINKAYENEASLALGLSYGEAEVLFMEMDEARALAKLEKIAKGEEFTKEDFETCDGDRTNGLLDPPTLNEWAWENRSDYFEDEDE